MSVVFVIIVAILTVLISYFSIGKLIRILQHHEIVDIPNERTLHQGDIPRGGGLVIITVLLFAIVLLSVFTPVDKLLIGLFFYIFAWAGLSWYDDQVSATAKFRFASQCLFAIIAVAMFGYIGNVQLTNQLSINLGWLGAVGTVLGILWLANLYNFMDGLDGLAASQTIVAAITIAFWFYQVGDETFSLLCIVLAAASYGFILWNWSPAKIFMGDVGSVTIGAFFAFITVVGVTQYQIPVLSFLILLSVFILDASITLGRRLIKKEKFWLAHRTHYYQRLAAVGVAHNKIAVFLLGLMIVCSLLASISVQYRDMIGLSLVMTVLLFIMIILTVIYLERSKQKK